MGNTKNKLKFILWFILCLTLLTGCGSSELSDDFNEEEVKQAAGDVIEILNNKDTKSLLEISTVQVKEAFTDEVLEQIYEAIDEGGDFKEVKAISVASTADKSTKEEFAVAVVKAEYEIKTFTYTISFTKQMKLAGLFYK